MNVRCPSNESKKPGPRILDCFQKSTPPHASVSWHLNGNEDILGELKVFVLDARSVHPDTLDCLSTLVLFEEFR